MKKISTPDVKNILTINHSGKKPQLALFNDLYDRYAPAFYGEIKQNLYQQDICDKTLIDAYRQIWENIAQIDQEKENYFIWCYRIVRKEIRKKKVDLLLKEIFACQNYPIRKVA